MTANWRFNTLTRKSKTKPCLQSSNNTDSQKTLTQITTHLPERLARLNYACSVQITQIVTKLSHR